MDRHQQKLRRAAAEAFAESLNQLEEQLLEDEQPSPKEPPQLPTLGHVPAHRWGDRLSPSPNAPHRPIADADVQAFAEAVSDIEQFINARH